MSSKPETSFRLGVEKHLPSKERPHREKMANPYSGGTADSWYSGTAADLWIEYKFITVPVRDGTMIDLVGGKKPPISALQQNWLLNRWHEKRSVWVIVGCKAGGVIYTDPTGWETNRTAAEFRSTIIDRKTIAERIARHTLGVVER